MNLFVAGQKGLLFLQGVQDGLVCPNKFKCYIIRRKITQYGFVYIGTKAKATSLLDIQMFI